MKIVVAVLAGGLSTRMGRDKAGVELEGRSLADWMLGALQDMSVVFVGRDHPGRHSIQDAPGSGPLAGLAAALGLGAEGVLLVAVDQPWLRRRTVAELIARFDGRPVVPLDDGIRQVTCAVYPRSLARAAARLAGQGRALQSVLDEVEVDEVLPEEWRGWGEDGRSWFGVNTPHRLEEGWERFGRPGAEE